MKKLIAPILAAVSLVLVIVWQLLDVATNYYIVAASLMLLSILAFLISYESGRPDARELALVSSLIAIAVLSRAMFYLVPQVKPIGAVVVVSGACLGAKRGYVIGLMSAFISNFIFGQGMWTPFQMVALALVGLLSGILLSPRTNRVVLALVGFVLIFVPYGIVVDLSTVLTITSDYSLQSVLAVYLSALPFNLVFAGSTAVFLLAFGNAFVKKITRITTKYGI